MSSELFNKMREIEKQQQEKELHNANRPKHSFKIRLMLNLAKYLGLTLILFALAYIGFVNNIPFMYVIGIIIYIAGSIFIHIY